MAFRPALDVSDDSDALVANEILRGGDFDSSNLGAETRNLVVNGWRTAQMYAADAFNTADRSLNSLAYTASQLSTIPNIDSNLTDISVALQDLAALAEAPLPPSVTVDFTDQDYSSEELTLLQTYIDQWVAGAYTGLPPAVEQAIWERGRARDAVASAKKTQEAFRQFASRGFSKPPGALAAALQDAAQEAQNNAVTLSRDIAIKQADLEQSNRHFAFETATKIQTVLVSYMQDKMRRALEVARQNAQMVVEIFGHQAQMYGAEANFAGAYLGAQASMSRVAADVQIAEGNLRIEAAKANVQAMIQKATLLLESIRASAQISGQLASAALAAVNLSGGVHDSSGWSVAVSDSRSRAVSATIGSQSNRQENYTP